MVLLAATLSLLHSPLYSLVGATRKESAGWIYLKLAGKPKDVGYQYGTLVSTEIDEAHRVLEGMMKRDTGKSWPELKQIAKDVFWSHVDQEYKDEMQGQADALIAKGYKYDVYDVLTFNAHIELGDYYLPWKAKAGKSLAPLACSASVATGKATKDGKVVMAHNFWWGYLTGQRFNVMVDIKPSKGHRVMFDAIAGFIHSGTDYGINDAGIMISETTISGFEGFDPNGIPEFVRMRKSLQYSNSLADVVRIFKDGNNGGYANTWLLADTKNNEIGKLQLGLKNVIFDSTKDGVYVGSNFPEDKKLMAEECKSYSPDPSNNCEMRRARWTELYKQNIGKVDAEMAKGFLADDLLDARSPAGGGTCNSKVSTSAMVKDWKIWSRMGFSNGQAMSMAGPRKSEPFLKDIASQPWVVLGER